VKVILAVDPIAPVLTGIGRYTWELATRLPIVPGIGAIRFFRFGQWVKDPRVLRSSKRHAVATRQALASSRAAMWAYSQVYPLVAWSRLRNHRSFLYHSPNYFLPPFRGPSVSTFHDLSVYRHPEFHPPARVSLMRREIPKALRRADHLITDSHFVAAELSEYLSVARDRISVVPCGVSDTYFPRSVESLEGPLARYGLAPKSYALCVSTVEPRKNIANLLRAYETLPSNVRARVPLVLCGDRGWISEEIHAAIERARREQWLRYFGYMPEEELPLIYAGACVFIYPSFYEGFGLPVLEAMASGVPVVAANSTSIPEVAGDCALLVEPNAIGELADAVERSLDDEDWRERAARCGIARAAELTWAACASKTVDVYREVMSRVG